MKLLEDGTGLTNYDGYAQAETVLLVGNYQCMPVNTGSMGKPTPDFDVAIVDEDGEELGPVAVERTLIEHPATAESAVVACSDALRGSIVRAFVILAPVQARMNLRETMPCSFCDRNHFNIMWVADKYVFIHAADIAVQEDRFLKDLSCLWKKVDLVERRRILMTMLDAG